MGGAPLAAAERSLFPCLGRANERKIDFRALTRQYEQEFFADMAQLGVPGPTVLTRVSEVRSCGTGSWYGARCTE